MMKGLNNMNVSKVLTFSLVLYTNSDALALQEHKYRLLPPAGKRKELVYE
jgi:hypothetical protein